MLRTWRQKATLTDVVVTGIGIFIGIMLLTSFYRAIFVPPYNLKYSYFTWADLVVKGLALGGVYALIAMGYTLVYGILRMINFAHSEVFMSGPFTAVFLAKWLANIGFYQQYPFISILSDWFVVVGRLDGRCHPAGTDSLPPIEKCSTPCSSDYGDWSIFFPNLHIPRVIWIRRLCVSDHSRSPGFLEFIWRIRSV